MGQVFTFAGVGGGILQRGSENVTPVSVNVNEPFKLR